MLCNVGAYGNHWGTSGVLEPSGGGGGEGRAKCTQRKAIVVNLPAVGWFLALRGVQVSGLGCSYIHWKGVYWRSQG